LTGSSFVLRGRRSSLVETDPASRNGATDKENLFGLRSGGGQMRTSRFTDEQIIAIVREYEAGAKLTELCRRHNVSPTTFYKWRAPKRVV
jgi:hypothetical protein